MLKEEKMSKRLVILFCALFVFAAAVPAFAAVQNIKVSGDILARYIGRNDFDLTKGDGANNEDEISTFNSVVRLRVDADLTDNVGATVRLINERNWKEANSASTDIDLDLAYVTLKEFLYSPLTVTIGRQELHFGNDMIIGDGVGNPNANAVSGGIGTNQTSNYGELGLSSPNTVNGDLAYRKAFDSIRATLNYDPLVIDVVYAVIDHENVSDGSSNDWINLYGINAAYQFADKWNTLAEGYFWSKDNSSEKHKGVDKLDSVQTIGGRVSTMPNSKLNLQQEMAFQFGKKLSPAGASTVERDRSAWASQSVVMYTPGWKYTPTFGLIYSYFSGDADRDSGSNPNSDKKYHAWDPMFENQTNGHIINALFPQSNAHNIDMMGKFSPIEDVWIQLDYVYLLMAKASSRSGVMDNNDYDGNGYYYNAGKKALGQEIDVNLIYNYTEDVQLGLLCGWFFPGKAIASENVTTGYKQGETAAEAIASCKVSF